MGNNILKGKKGIIFGALDNSSIAWKTAERVYDEGGEFILTNAPVSIRMGSINDLAKKTNLQTITKINSKKTKKKPKKKPKLGIKQNIQQTESH